VSSFWGALKWSILKIEPFCYSYTKKAMAPEDIKYAASIFTLFVIAIIIVLTVVFIWLVSKKKDKEDNEEK